MLLDCGRLLKVNSIAFIIAIIRCLELRFLGQNSGFKKNAYRDGGFVCLCSSII